MSLMARIDLNSPRLHDELSQLVGQLPGVTARLVDGTTVTGAVTRLSDPGRALEIVVTTAAGRRTLPAAALLSLEKAGC